MKDYKLLLAGLTLLLLAIFVALITWLWTHNRKNIDPLPIMANDNDSETVDTDDTTKPTPNRILHVRAAENLQVPLDDIIVSFESRYPHIQVLTSYVSSNHIHPVRSRSKAPLSVPLGPARSGWTGLGACRSMSRLARAEQERARRRSVRPDGSSVDRRHGRAPAEWRGHPACF